jgi:hypothetical protein
MSQAAQGFLWARQADARLSWQKSTTLNSAGAIISSSAGLNAKIVRHAGVKFVRLWTDTNHVQMA